MRAVSERLFDHSVRIAVLFEACMRDDWGRFEALGYILTKKLPILGGKQAIGLLLASGGWVQFCRSLLKRPSAPRGVAC
jgi:hypothetical protein